MRLLSIQSHKLRLWLFCNQTAVIIIIIANVITVIVASIGNQSQTLKLALDFQMWDFQILIPVSFRKWSWPTVTQTWNEQ